MMAIIPTLMTDSIAEYAEKNFTSETPELKQLLIDAKRKVFLKFPSVACKEHFCKIWYDCSMQRSSLRLGLWPDILL